MRIFKNKFFVTAMAVALMLCVLPTALAVMGFSDHVRSALGTVSIPFRAAFNWIADGVTGFGDYFAGISRLREENEELRKKLEQYEYDAARADIAEGENAWLRENMEFGDKYYNCNMCPASVIGSSGGYSATYTINCGSESGIQVNMAVVTSDGVVGYVRTVGLGFSTVSAVTDTTAAVGVCNAAGVFGTAEGSIEYRGSGHCVINGLTSSQVVIGDTFYTSGYGNIYPSGLPVGEVVEAVEDSYSHSVTAVLRTAVDFKNLTRVMVITSVEMVNVPSESGTEATEAAG